MSDPRNHTNEHEKLEVFVIFRGSCRLFADSSECFTDRLLVGLPLESVLTDITSPIYHLRFTIYHSPLMRRAIYPGSFDPVTNGHLDIIERGCKLFDEIIIAILINPEKRPFFTIEERRQILEEVLKGIERGTCGLRVDSFEGLLVHYAVAQQAHAIVRGIRAISDYEYELQMALMNRRLEPSIETVFMMPAEKYSYVSSRLVKEVFQLGGELQGLVPPLVEHRMKETRATGQ